MSSDHVEAMPNPGPDPKPRARVKDAAAIRRKVRQDPSCRACGQPGSDGHHVLYRSLGGDDVEDNIVNLCHHCHMIVHYVATDEAGLIRSEIGKRLTDVEVAYVLERRGADAGAAFLHRYYSIPEGDRRFAVKTERRNVPRGIGNLHAIADL